MPADEPKDRPSSSRPAEPRRWIAHRLELVPAEHVGWLSGQEPPPRDDPAAAATWHGLVGDAWKLHAEFGEAAPIGISITTEGGTDPATHGLAPRPGGTAVVTMHVWDAGPRDRDAAWEPDDTRGHNVLEPQDGPQPARRPERLADEARPRQAGDLYYVQYRVDWAAGEDMTAWTDIRAASPLEAAVEATSRTTLGAPHGTGRDRVPALRDEPIRVSVYRDGDRQYAGRFSRDEVERERAAREQGPAIASHHAYTGPDDPFRALAEIAEELATSRPDEISPEQLPEVARMFEELAASDRAEGNAALAERRERLAGDLRARAAGRQAPPAPAPEQRAAHAGRPGDAQPHGPPSSPEQAAEQTPAGREKLARVLLEIAARDRATGRPELAAFREAMAARLTAPDAAPRPPVQQTIPDQPGMLAPAARPVAETARSR